MYAIRSYYGMTIDVSFATPFDEKPNIVIGVTKLDATTQTNIRYSVSPMSVSRDGFTIKISTRNNFV